MDSQLQMKSTTSADAGDGKTWKNQHFDSHVLLGSATRVDADDTSDGEDSTAGDSKDSDSGVEKLVVSCEEGGVESESKVESNHVVDEEGGLYESDVEVMQDVTSCSGLMY